MHVTMANNYLYIRGGSERVMYEEAAMLERQGHTVSFFGRCRPEDAQDGASSLLPPLIDHEALPMRGKIAFVPRLVYNGDTGRRFYRFLQSAPPDIIHGHNIYGGLTTAICDVARRSHIPMVLTLHDYKLACPSYLMLNHGQVCEACLPNKYYHCLRKRCHKQSLLASMIYTVEAYFNHWLKKYSHVRYFLCPSNFMLTKMLAAGIHEERLRYLPNAVALEQYEPDFRHTDYLLYVGRLSAEKGVFTLLQAMREVNAPLMIVGDGPLRPVLEEFIMQANLAARVRLLGHQQGEHLAHLYREAAGVIVPSECYENAPMTVLEAYAYGKPVVGADIGGIPEMIDPGKTGLLFPPGDVPALVECLQTLWRDRTYCTDMGHRARAVASERFALHAHIDKLVDIYRAALGAT